VAAGFIFMLCDNFHATQPAESVHKENFK